MAITVSASAPGRCGILGNPSDIYGGYVLSCSLPARAHCRLTIGNGAHLPDDPTLWNAVVNRYPITDCAVEWSTNIPRSSGLAGSTALMAATLACAMKLANAPLDLTTTEGRATFAEIQRDIEIFEAGVMGGYQDAYMVTTGGLQLLNFAGKHPGVRGGPHGVLEAQNAPLPFLLITTGVERLSGSVHGPMVERWLKGDREVIEAMEWIGSIAPEGLAALKSGNYTKLAELMDENHRLVASLGGSGEPVDKLIAACKQHGAFSAKLAGAGMGGTVIALTDDPAALQKRLQSVGYTKFMQPEVSDGLRFED